MLLPYLNKDLIEAGCDEAGRGCLAGAVYAAAVILPKDFKKGQVIGNKLLLLNYENQFLFIDLDEAIE